MSRSVVTVRTSVAPRTVWRACLASLEVADPARGVSARRCTPSPPRVGSSLNAVTAAGERRSRIVELQAPVLLVTESAEGNPGVRRELRLEDDGAGGCSLTLATQVGLDVATGRFGRVLDRLIYGRVQRRDARVTLRRIVSLATEAADR